MRLLVIEFVFIGGCAGPVFHLFSSNTFLKKLYYLSSKNLHSKVFCFSFPVYHNEITTSTIENLNEKHKPYNFLDHRRVSVERVVSSVYCWWASHCLKFCYHSHCDLSVVRLISYHWLFLILCHLLRFLLRLRAFNYAYVIHKHWSRLLPNVTFLIDHQFAHAFLSTNRNLY